MAFIILILLSLFTISPKVKGLSCYFEWLKTKIDVPYNANIYDYIDMYVVKFYVNGKESNDFVVSMEENATTFSTVLTYMIGIYRVTYLAYNTEYNVYSYQDIIFNVYDDKKPNITGPDYLRFLVGEEIDYRSYFNISDNYNTEDQLSFYVDDRDVSYDILGTYPVTIEVEDSSYNKASKKIKIEIFDNLRPTIKVIKNLVFSYGLSYDLSEYFTAYDNYDNNPTLEIYQFDFTKLGRQNIVIEAKDSSNNTIRQTFNALIIDDICPSITLTKSFDTIDISTIDNIDELLFSYIYEISDNYSTKDNIHLSINSPLTEKEVGQFEIIYLVTDQNGNSKSASLRLDIKEMVGPEFVSQDSYEFEINSEIDLLSLVEVIDNYDNQAKDNVEVVNSNINTSVPGEYRVLYRAYNNSGNYTLHELKVVIKDKDLNVNSQVEKNTDDQKLGFIITFSVEIICLFVFAIYLRKRKKL